MALPENVTIEARDNAAMQFFGGAVAATPKPDPAPGVQETAPTPAPEAKQAEPAPEAKPADHSLAALIREAREGRRAKETQEAEAKSWRERAEAAEARLARFEKTDVVQDSVGWAETMGLEPDEIATVGESLLYSLVPDRADAQVRVRLLEAKARRKEKLAEKAEREQAERATAEAAEAEKAQAMKVYNDYVTAATAAIKSAPPEKLAESYPDSVAWFGDDHDNYAASLVATANNLADAARARGESADISLAKVAEVLEATIASRMNRRKGRQAPQETQTTQSGGGQATVQTMTTQGLTGGGAPRSPAKTEAEREARAAEVLFRKR